MKRPITLINVTPDMDQEEVVQALMAGLRKHKAKKVVKHYGPGPHPSGSPQSVHRGGMSVGTQDPLFGEAFPNPKTKVTFTDSIAGQYEKATDKGKRLLSGYDPGYDYPFTTEEKLHLLTGVEELEAEFGPDALPDNIEFVLGYDGFDPTFAWTYSQGAVKAGDDPNVVFINAAFYRDDLDSLAMHLGERTFAGGKEIDDVLTMRDRIVFHELVHIMDNHHRLSPKREVPRYNGSWYEFEVKLDNPELPSAYAAESASEFLAEALVDYTFNEDASEISVLTGEIVKDVIAEDYDSARERGKLWREQEGVT